MYAKLEAVVIGVPVQVNLFYPVFADLMTIPWLSKLAAVAGSTRLVCLMLLALAANISAQQQPPGTEGEGVADVLFGDYKPTGKLPWTWPRNNDQLSANNMMGKPLFPYGFGLTY